MDNPQLKVKTKISSPGVIVAHVFMITLAVTVVALPGFFLAAASFRFSLTNTSAPATSVSPTPVKTPTPTPTLIAGKVKFLRGDANSDGKVNISDAIYILRNKKLLSTLNRPGTAIAKANADLFSCPESMDVDNNGLINDDDAKYLLAFLFQNGKAPSAPGATVLGVDPKPGIFSCRCSDNSCTKETKGMNNFAMIQGGGGSIGDPECNDGVDNDGDGGCDSMGCTVRGVQYPADPDCVNSAWDQEDPLLRSKTFVEISQGDDSPGLISLGDINSDGKMEIIKISQASSCLMAIDPITGRDYYAQANQWCDQSNPYDRPMVIDLYNQAGGKVIALKSNDMMSGGQSIVLYDAASGKAKCRYTPAQSLVMPMNAPIYNYTAGDINKDGKQELIVLTARDFETGVFGNPDYSVKRYINIDVVEPVGCSNILTFKSQMVDFYSPEEIQDPRMMTVANVDSDNRLDILVSNTSGVVKYSLPSSGVMTEQFLMMKDASGNTMPAGGAILGVADFDRDSMQEFIIGQGWATSNEPVYAVKYTTTQFSDQWGGSYNVLRLLWKIDNVSSWYDSRIADLDNNGTLELITNDGSFISIYNTSVATGAAITPIQGMETKGVNTMVIADMDGDGRRDIVTLGYGLDPEAPMFTGSKIMVFNLLGEKMGEQYLPGDSMSFSLSIADIDKNGLLDIVVDDGNRIFVTEVNSYFYQAKPRDGHPWKSYFYNFQNWNTANSCTVNSDCAYSLACGTYTCVNYQCVRNYSACPATPVGAAFMRGDVDKDGKYSINDPVTILSYLFQGKPSLTCLDAADVDDNGKVDMSDAVYLLGYQFLSDPSSLPAPFNVKGTDPTQDNLPPCT
ncbi:MAG: hypothetical protein US74_C0004G0013 [Parcubacteria group bacterium GW2011_GWA2_38_13]|nr:MAG: hypothetical protein US74_C0004G0013 [Parcubacteria group bacterium GW2011_GWA2_38_13]